MKMQFKEITRWFNGVKKTFLKPVGLKMGTGKTYKANGAHECVRRRRQIANGTLQVMR